MVMDAIQLWSETYAATELKNPVSALSGTTPTNHKISEHVFFDLEKSKADLLQAIS